MWQYPEYLNDFNFFPFSVSRMTVTFSISDWFSVHIGFEKVMMNNNKAVITKAHSSECNLN